MISIHKLSNSESRVKASSTVTSGEGGVDQRSEKPFDNMNNIAANLILNMTSSARFEGSLNVDLNEITMNLVPFPKIHYLVSSQTPLYSLTDVNLPSRRLDQMFTDAFSKDHQLIKADPKPVSQEFHFTLILLHWTTGVYNKNSHVMARL